MNKLFQQVVEENESTPTLRRQRSAALVLHGMSEADRAWALAELSEEERELLRPLIEELQALGVATDAQTVSSALGTLPRVVRRRDASSPAHRQVARALPDQVLPRLLEEPVELVRRLLAMSAWPWRAEVVAALNARRGELFDADPAIAPSTASALDQAVLTRFAQQLSGLGQGAEGGAAAGSSSGPGWLAWLRARGWIR